MHTRERLLTECRGLDPRSAADRGTGWPQPCSQGNWSSMVGQPLGNNFDNFGARRGALSGTRGEQLSRTLRLTELSLPKPASTEPRHHNHGTAARGIADRGKPWNRGNPREPLQPVGSPQPVRSPQPLGSATNWVAATSAFDRLRFALRWTWGPLGLIFRVHPRLIQGRCRVDPGRNRGRFGVAFPRTVKYWIQLHRSIVRFPDMCSPNGPGAMRLADRPPRKRAKEGVQKGSSNCRKGTLFDGPCYAMCFSAKAHELRDSRTNLRT